MASTIISCWDISCSKINITLKIYPLTSFMCRDHCIKHLEIEEYELNSKMYLYACSTLFRPLGLVHKVSKKDVSKNFWWHYLKARINMSEKRPPISLPLLTSQRRFWTKVRINSTSKTLESNLFSRRKGLLSQRRWQYLQCLPPLDHYWSPPSVGSYIHKLGRD